MSGNSQYSPKAKSELVKLFVMRSGVPAESDPRDVIEALATRLRRRGRTQSKPVFKLDPFLAARNISDFRTVRTLTCDGHLEARGRTFRDGFAMAVNKNMPEERIRFTIAHELFHTFFYELVPEIKFCDHASDEEEEMLCNLGAAAFLMPARGLRRHAAKAPVSIETLERLAEEYGVSFTAMFLRLRALRIWKCELSIWRRQDDGSFELQKLYGGRKTDWRWFESAVPTSAWQSSNSTTGRTFLHYCDDRGECRLRPISYQASRRGESLVALFGPLDTRKHETLSLFEPKSAGQSGSPRSMRPPDK